VPTCKERGFCSAPQGLPLKVSLFMFSKLTLGGSEEGNAII